LNHPAAHSLLLSAFPVEGLPFAVMEFVGRIARYGVPLLTVWSLFVWGNRVRNILADGEGLGFGWDFASAADLFGNPTSDSGRLLSLCLSGAFILIAAWVIESAYRLWRDGGSDPFSCVTSAAHALAVLNIVVWPIRAYGILISDEWSGGFKAVHTVLALVSVVLGLLVLFHRYGRAGDSGAVNNSESVADPV
jgi:hypothetical protein